MESQVTIPTKANLKAWMAQNLGLETLESELKNSIVHNVWVVPGLRERMVLSNIDLFNKIESIILAYYRIDISTFSSKHKLRKEYYVAARYLIFYFMKQKTKMSCSAIGRLYYKDHATVLHALKVINNLNDTDKNFRKELAYFEGEMEKYSVK